MQKCSRYENEPMRWVGGFFIAKERHTQCNKIKRKHAAAAEPLNLEAPSSLQSTLYTVRL